MACQSCKRRRKMLEEAKRRRGIKGVIREIPKVVKDVVKRK